jgi:hypothetical protein
MADLYKLIQRARESILTGASFDWDLKWINKCARDLMDLRIRANERQIMGEKEYSERLEFIKQYSPWVRIP